MELRTFIAAKKKEGVLAPGVDTNIQRLMDAYSAGGTGFLDTVEFARLQEEIISPQDKAMGTLEQVGISVAFQEENARLAQTTLNEVRNDLNFFVAAQDKARLHAPSTAREPNTPPLPSSPLLASTHVHAHPPAVAAIVGHRGDAAKARPTNGREVILAREVIQHLV
jgi:hypothetical protein